jgi:hypothetical protein
MTAAAVSAHLLSGMLFMAGFGFGTIPAMVGFLDFSSDSLCGIPGKNSEDTAGAHDTRRHLACDPGTESGNSIHQPEALIVVIHRDDAHPSLIVSFSARNVIQTGRE